MTTDHPSPRLHRLLGAAGLALTLALAACGGSDDDEAAGPKADFEMIAGADACGSGCATDAGGGDGGVGGDGGGGGGDGAGGGLGEMRNVLVTARKPDGTVLASAKLKDNLVSIYDRQYKGAFILEYKDDGSGNGAYFDEAVQYWVPLGSTTLHVLVPRLTHHVSANPLSEAAYQLARQRHGASAALSAEQMTNANNTVRDAFNARVPLGYRTNDVTNYNVAVPNALFGSELPNTVAGRFGTLMAALPRAALRFNPALLSRKPAVVFMNQLVADILDDEVVNASAAPAEAYDVNLPEQLFDALLEARNAYAAGTQPVPQRAAANLCFNTALFTVGSRWDLTYREMNTDSSDSSFSTEVTRQTTFQGAAALEVAISVPEQQGVISRSYFGPDLTNGISFLGSLENTSAGQNAFVAARTVYTPPLLDDRYLLRPGQTTTLSSTLQTTLLDSAGQPVGEPITTQQSQRVTFVGYEDVEVVAGVFRNACKYETTDDANGTFETQWIISSGEGVPLRTQTVFFQQESSSDEQLVRGTVNGRAITPDVIAGRAFRAPRAH